MTWIRGYLGTVHRDGLAGSWTGHALFSLLLTLLGVLIAWSGPSWWLAGLILAGLAYLVWGWRERSWTLPIFAIPAVGMCWTLTPYPVEGGLLGATVGLVFYWERERANKRAQIEAGTYDRDARLDKVGDIVGAVSIFACALTMYLATLL